MASNLAGHENQKRNEETCISNFPRKSKFLLEKTNQASHYFMPSAVMPFCALVRSFAMIVGFVLSLLCRLTARCPSYAVHGSVEV